jgi:F0F1-type ATP synthase assembly protein I
MKKNMGTMDRRIRIILGLLVVAAGIYFKTWWGLMGLVFLATSLISWCPLYVSFGLSTRKNKA